MQYADIAPNAKTKGIFETYTYAIPAEMQSILAVGQLVQIPLGPRTINGIVTAIHDTPPTFATKDIKKIIDLEPAVDTARIELARQIAQHYFTSMSLVLFHMLPPSIRKRKRTLKSKSTGEKITGEEVLNPLDLNSYQQQALTRIVSAIKKHTYAPYLLHGVTGSGKTEVYLRAMAEALSQGGGGIFIIPEISLTPQSITRFEAVFGADRIAVVHSHLTAGERSDTWQAVRAGAKDIVIGSRSAIFAPVKDLRIIIVDEEHDLISFKSDQTPRYELHTVAEMLARLAHAVLVLGSATPLITTYDRVLTGEYSYLSLPERVDGKVLPPVEIVDMNHERSAGNYTFLAEKTQEELSRVLASKKQAIVFLNRRGMATLSRCQECGEIASCEDCDSALVYHMSNHRLWCHQCTRQYEQKVTCSRCGSIDIRLLGQGTEKIEMEIKQLYPHAIVARMDRDTMERGGDYERVFEAFRAGHIDILIGTQMVVHGWDIPNVDLAIVVSLDGPLMIPDYRSQEGVFQILEQLAGRTGRGANQGKMMIQTLYPDHEVFGLVKRHDYTGFVKDQLAQRERFGYPPYRRLVILSFGATGSTLALERARRLTDELLEAKAGLNEADQQSIEIIGPIEPMMARKYGKYWQQIIIKLKTQQASDPGADVVGRLLEKVPKDWVIDIDPVNVL